MSEPGTWSTNTTLEEIARLMRGRRVVVMTHVRPDGDAIGSTLALTRALNIAKPGAAEAWYFGPQPLWFKDLAKDTPCRLLEHTTVPPPDAITEPDVIAILDTGSWTQLEPGATWLRPRRDRVVLVDHHVQGDAEVAGRRFIDTGAAAACQPVAELCRLILGKSRVGELPREVAETLYLGIGTDTGWFKHSNVTPRVLRDAAELLETGVDHSELFRVIEQQDRPARLALLGRALATLRFDAKDSIASMVLTKKDFDECNAAPGDASGFADYAQTIASVRVVAMLTETERDAQGRPVTKISLRSKNTPDSPDVNKVCKVFGGGGHVRASGARIQAEIGEARRRVVEELVKARGV